MLGRSPGEPVVNQILTIYMRLLDEGVDCRRLVEEVMVQPGVFKVVSAQPDPNVEIWEFDHGGHVAGEIRNFHDGEKQLVAVRAVSSAG